MKYIIVALLLVGLLTGCSPEILRPAGKPYSGYSCQKSLMHFYSYCSDEKLTKEEFEAKVQFCEKELATKICDKEQAALLWCMGRVEPGTYTRGGGVGVPVGTGGVVISSGQSSTLEGCSCASFEGALKKCRMEKGIFDK
ncbi:MAG: hypothetical protein A2031_07285 [Deltaproteobacteria bacterium RBG_19FT_COMBO_43_11]|nr:MAG: hypothetical protein A2031_07285 [Deltaproteobacteria bacterium RBG_19FT_COMBO_43_11]